MGYEGQAKMTTIEKKKAKFPTETTEQKKSVQTGGGVLLVRTRMSMGGWVSGLKFCEKPKVLWYFWNCFQPFFGNFQTKYAKILRCAR